MWRWGKRLMLSLTRILTRAQVTREMKEEAQRDQALEEYVEYRRSRLDQVLRRYDREIELTLRREHADHDPKRSSC